MHIQRATYDFTHRLFEIINWGAFCSSASVSVVLDLEQQTETETLHKMAHGTFVFPVGICST